MAPPTLPADLAQAAQYLAAGRFAEARQASEKVLASRPDDPDALHISGLALFRDGDPDEAIDRLVRAIEAQPENVDMLANLGRMQFERGEFEAAHDCLAAAADLAPDDLYLRVLMATALQRLDRLDEAETVYLDILKRAPDFVPALYDYGHVLRLKGKTEAAIERFDAATRINPTEFAARSAATHLRQTLCRWQGFDRIRAELVEPAMRAFSGAVPQAARPPLPLNLLALPVKVTPSEFLTLVRAHGFPASPQFSFAPTAPSDAGKRLRIGYVSSDFREHAVGHILRPLLHLHDRKSFDVAGYALTRGDGSPERAHFATELPRFVDLADEDEAAAARRIHEDKVDILVDLNGYTRDNRLHLFARRPSPIQVSWLGFAGTLGNDLCDYLIGDGTVTPAADQPHYSERLVRLPDAYIAVEAAQAAPAPARSALGLPVHGLVLAAFSATYKIEPVVFGIWMRLLAKIPGSVLWLRIDNEEALRNLRQATAAQGVDPARLIAAPRAKRPDHLARHRAADIFLDTLFYGGHATVADALATGLPVVTVAGSNFAARVGTSLLHAAGLPELVAASPEDYEALALRLATNGAARADARARLAAAQKTAPLFDPARFVRNLESAYRTMWENRVAGKKPEPIDVGI